MDKVFERMYLSIFPELSEIKGEREDIEKLEKEILSRVDDETKELVSKLIEEYGFWMTDIMHDSFKHGFKLSAKFANEMYKD